LLHLAGRASTPAGGGTSSPLGPVTEEEGAAAEAAAGEGAAEEEEEPPIEYPEPVTLSEAEFEEAVASGRLLEHHSDLFVHEMAKHRHGTSAEAIKEVIMSGKLPLLELEAEGAAAIKARGIDCLTIFLRPPSEQVFADRVTSWLTESDEEISARMERAKAQVRV
jgi:guanylate kinase